MTPEESMEHAVAAVGVPYGHWPYTQHLDGIVIGYRPREDSIAASGANRPVRVRVSYDLVIVRTRSAKQAEAERVRFALYEALRAAGWAVTGTGPETYVAEQKRHYWPVTAERGFAIDANAQPVDARTWRREKEAEANG